MRDVLPCAVPYNHIFEANRALDIVIGRVFLFFFWQHEFVSRVHCGEDEPRASQGVLRSCFLELLTTPSPYLHAASFEILLCAPKAKQHSVLSLISKLNSVSDFKQSVLRSKM